MQTRSKELGKKVRMYQGYYSRKYVRKVQRNRHKGIQEKQKAIGKKVCKKGSNDVGKKVCKKELGNGRRKDVG